MKNNFDVEVGFISKLLQERNISIIKDFNIKSDYFTGDNRNAFDFILQMTSQIGEVPTVRAFKQEFPRYKLETLESGEVGTEENAKYWSDKLKEKVKHNYIANAVEKSAESLQNYDAESAILNLKKSIIYIEGEVNETTDVDITKNTESRKEAYLKKKQSKGMIGYPTRFSKFDYITKGIAQKDTLTTIIATTGIGKTFLEVILGTDYMLNGLTVLHAVTEMSVAQMQDRYDCFLLKAIYGVDFSYNDFKSGKLPPKIEKMYFDFLENDLPHLESLHIVTATSVIGLEADIEKYNPDVVLIDGAYLMDDDAGAKEDWARITHITRDTKKLAKRRHIPIIINTQADEHTSKKTGPSIGDIKYSQAIGQDSDNILTLYRDDIMLQDNEMGVKLLKQREGTLGKILLEWDFNTMTFQEIYSDSAESDFDEEDGKEDTDDATLEI